MKMFKFKKRAEEITEIACPEVWMIKWVSVTLDRSFGSDGTKFSPATQWEYKAFTGKFMAEMFKEELLKAFELTGCCRCNVVIYEQEDFSNI